MTTYNINVYNKMTNKTIVYNIKDECTVGELLNNILKVNICWQEVMITHNDSYEDRDDDNILNLLLYSAILTDIGLGSDWNNITISEKELSKDETLIIKNYSKEALEAYKICMGEENDDVEYNIFSDNYRGYFSNPDDFVDYCLESEYSYNNLPWYIQKCIDKEKNYLYEVYMKDFWEENNHYFWGH